MQRNLVRSLLFISIAVGLIGASVTGMRVGMVHANMGQRVTLHTQTAPLLRKAHLLQAADSSQQMNLSIGLQLRNETDLDSLINAIYDPQSPQYHHYLTSNQFKQLFAPTPDQVQLVTGYLQSQGLTVTGVAPNNLLIDAIGSVTQVQQTFQVHINTYRLGSHTFYANASPPSVPAPLSDLIASIGGLDDSLHYYPLYQRLSTHLASTAAEPTGLAPKDLARAYDASPLHDGGILGDNQTIALFELDGYQQSDVAQYFQKYEIPTPNITTIPVDNYSGAATQGAIEVELDIEVIAGMAPHANQLIYEGPNTIQGLNDTYNKIVTDNKAQVVSISWGLCETSLGAAELHTLDAIFKQGAAQGISFVAASGDSGAYDCQDNNLAVDSPADDPYVTGVGGTSLQLNAGAYGSESVWSNSTQTQRGPKGAGSGGGISNTFGLPSWQSGPGVHNQYSNGYREVPDVSADADPAPGYSIYCTVANAGCPSTGWMTVGGTSASSPLWASSIVLLNQYLQAHNKGRIGHANPALYTLLNTQQEYPAFHDITTGNNLYYSATVGYDMAVGIGSPDLHNIARDFLTTSTGGTPTPTPTSIPSPTPVPTNTPTPTSTPTSPPSLIKNGDFESGQDPWKESSSQNGEIIDPSNPHSGQYSAYLCGYMGCNDSIAQTFTIPTSYNKITVTYWWYSDTNKTVKNCLDTFTSRLQNSSGATIHDMQKSCNTDATNKWVQESFEVSGDLQKYKGKSVTLFFGGTNAKGAYETSDFFVDDVVVTVS